MMGDVSTQPSPEIKEMYKKTVQSGYCFSNLHCCKQRNVLLITTMQVMVQTGHTCNDHCCSNQGDILPNT
jgi:hypothetical protein